MLTRDPAAPPLAPLTLPLPPSLHRTAGLGKHLPFQAGGRDEESRPVSPRALLLGRVWRSVPRPSSVPRPPSPRSPCDSCPLCPSTPVSWALSILPGWLRPGLGFALGSDRPLLGAGEAWSELPQSHPHPMQFLPHQHVDSCQDLPRAPVPTLPPAAALDSWGTGPCRGFGAVGEREKGRTQRPSWGG